MRSRLVVLLVAFAGCGDSMLDRATSGAGCHAEDRPGSVGICDGGRLACRLGSFDGDGRADNGCEARVDQAGNDVSVFTLEPGGLGAVTIGGQFADTGLTGGWVAFRGTARIATIEAPCAYELLALQIGIGSYTIGSLSWTEGLVATSLPLTVMDDGSGLFVPSGSDLIGSFLVDGEKRVVSRAASPGISVVTDGQRVLVTGDQVALPFGGYPIERFLFVAEGTLLR